MVDYEQYLRLNHFPHIWCTGCGAGIVLKAVLRAVDRLGWAKDDVAVVSGIGCSSRAAGYVDFNTLHTTHGRAIPFATGLKMAKPGMHVIVMTGGGDATAIGGNHFIHAARRNIDLTVVIFNNQIYGMTGGQCSPTTPVGARASTSMYGNVEPTFDISGLATAAGAALVGRATTSQPRLCDQLIERGLRKPGFAVIEVIEACPTSFGRRNRMAKPVAMMQWQKDNAVPVAKAAKMTPAELEGKVVTGVLSEHDREEYIAQCDALAERIRQGQATTR